MALRRDGTRRAVRLGSVVLAGLLLLVLVANILWVLPSPTSINQPRMPPTVSPFPQFRMGPILHVVTLDPDANLSTRLLMTSLQGIVNREQVELYLGGPKVAGNTSRTLSFLSSRYNVSSAPMTLVGAIDAYANRSNGIAVFDSTRPESIDITTMIAAQQNEILVGSDLVVWLHARTRLPVLFDYASSDWASLDAIAAFDRALRDLYPSSATTLLAILPPDRWAIRDYLVATRTFVFYFPQGALATPFEAAATRRILHATPRGIPILGWFRSPTLTEENSFVQLASGEGKFVVGVQDVPNLSVLTALGRNETRRQASSGAAPLPLEDKTYVVLAVPDGDNVDFAAGRMQELWSEPVRGTIPFAWSLNPLLVELAPPLLDSYYRSATPLDQFIAAPSGAGYLYPDYAAAQDLSSFVTFSKRYLDASDMDVVWLLNAFAASEIPYSSGSLATYVDGLHPNGIVLDYDDQPRTRDSWVQADDEAVAPIVRSTHFWTTQENVLGKLEAATVPSDSGPQFLWLTIYTFRFDLQDGRNLVDALSARLGGRLQVVLPDQFFGLMRQDFLRTAKDRLRSVEANPLESFLFATTLASVRIRLRDADAFLAAGDSGRAADAAFLGLEELRGIAETEALLLSIGVLLLAGLVAFLASRSRRPASGPPRKVRPEALVFVATGVAILVFTLREALSENFWTYPTILLGILVSGAHRPLRHLIDAAYPHRAPVAAALVFLVLSALAIRTTAAFPLAMIGALLALDTFLSRRSASSADVMAGVGMGTAIGFLGGFDLPTFAILAILQVASAFMARGPPVVDEPKGRRNVIVPGFLVALSLSGLSVAFYYSFSRRLGLQGDALTAVAGALLVLGPTLGILVRRTLPKVPARTAQVGGLAAAAALSGVILMLQGTLVTLLALLALFSAVSFAAMASLDEYADQGGDPRRALGVALLFLPLLVMFFRMPPIVYSLTVVALPEPLEYALYAPTVLLGGACLLLAAFVGLRGHVRTAVRKDYPNEADGGAVHP